MKKQIQSQQSSSRTNKENFRLNPETERKINEEFSGDAEYRGHSHRTRQTQRTRRPQQRPTRQGYRQPANENTPYRDNRPPTRNYDEYDNSQQYMGEDYEAEECSAGISEPPKKKRHFWRKLVLIIIILCMITMLINVGILFYTGQLWFNMPSKHDYPIKGPIVTEDMGTITWERFATRNNIQMAYIKATKGTVYTDSKFKENWSGSDDTQLPVGAIHEFDFSTDGKKQAEHFIKVCGKSMKGRLIPAVELKFYGLYGIFRPSTDKVQTMLTAFISTIEKAYGVKPIIYCTKSTYSKYIEGGFKGCPIWYESLYSKPSENISWSIWGYTSRVKISYYEKSSTYLNMIIANNTSKKSAETLISNMIIANNTSKKSAETLISNMIVKK